MRGIGLCVVGSFCTLALGWTLQAEEPISTRPKTPTVEVPPLNLPTGLDAVNLPNGKAVSRPLQPVQNVEPIPAETPKESGTTVVETKEVVSDVYHPIPKSWQSYDYLLWWPRSQTMPPLATMARGTAPRLGGPNTLVLIGNSPIDNPDVSGGRFTFGSSVNDAGTAGLAITYMFTGTRTSSATVSDVPGDPNRIVGRPVINPTTGASDVVPVTIPGTMMGSFTASLSSRITGWEINGLANLHAGETLRLHALAGYRYFGVNEGLRLDQVSILPTGGPNKAPIMTSTADQFDAHNNFNGGQIGLIADFSQGSVFLELTGKVALGRVSNIVQVSGQSVSVVPGFPFPGVSYTGNGVLAQPTNSGRFVQAGMAVLPEAAAKVGFRFQDRSRFYVAYNFLYLNEAVRPADQIDLRVDPAQASIGRPPAPVMTDRPLPLEARTDYWIQGLVFGVEYRY